MRCGGAGHGEVGPGRLGTVDSDGGECLWFGGRMSCSRRGGCMDDCSRLPKPLNVSAAFAAVISQRHGRV